MPGDQANNMTEGGGALTSSWAIHNDCCASKDWLTIIIYPWNEVSNCPDACYGLLELSFFLHGKKYRCFRWYIFFLYWHCSVISEATSAVLGGKCHEQFASPTQDKQLQWPLVKSSQGRLSLCETAAFILLHKEYCLCATRCSLFTFRYWEENMKILYCLCTINDCMEAAN